jgi:hypothetical protein
MVFIVMLRKVLAIPARGESAPHHPAARQPVLQAAVGMHNGVERRADPECKQYERRSNGDTVGPSTQQCDE